MHYTGTIWRPPYEAGSLLLEATAGCTHHRCRFCTLYDDLPFHFRLAAPQTMEADLREAQICQYDPWLRLERKLQGIDEGPEYKRVFLTGANPFVLSFRRLMQIADLIHRHLPSARTIGCFARVTDMTGKTDAQLQALRDAGFTGLTIGIESGDDETLLYMRKGYIGEDIVRECRRLEDAGIAYSFFVLAGIAGAGRGQDNAVKTAAVCNYLHPWLVGPNMLTVYPESDLYEEMRAGRWQEAGELEKYQEIRTLVERLEISTEFAAMGASNMFELQASLPKDKERLLTQLDEILATYAEDRLRSYRVNLKSL